MRVMESAKQKAGLILPGSGTTNIFIRPPYSFQIADALLSNFHLPRSTLLMLVSAFAASGKTSGRELVLQAYREAIRERYRFFSYGDAMLIL
jgi:S-adenosylmethionine:tRNA ribosyltransferase-isomerase